jgi:hypothetical protein
LTGVTVAHADFVGGDEGEAGFVDAAAPGAAEHLQDFIRAQGLFDEVPSIRIAGECDAAEGEVDACGEAHGGYDDSELAGFGERFDDSGACGVAQAAVMIGDAGFEHFGQMLAGEVFLFRGEGQGIWDGELTCEFGGEGFGGESTWGEDKDWPEIFGEGFGDEPRPVTTDIGGDVVIEAVGVDFVEWDGAELVPDEESAAAEAFEPFDDVVWVGDAAAEEEELGGAGCESDGELVIETAVGVAEHLVFVDDEEGGAFALDEAMFLSFEGGDEEGCVEVMGEVAGGDADVPAAGLPFGEFIVGECAGGDGVDGLVWVAALFAPEFEDERFTGAGGSLDDDIEAVAEGGDGLLLPEVGYDDAGEAGLAIELVGQGLHEQKIA